MEPSLKINLVELKTTNQTNCSKKLSNKKWDKCLNDYENYTKEYIKQYKKSLKGNSISLSKYPYMKAKSEVLCEKLNGAKNLDFLTEKQLKRISKILMKIAEVCGTLE